MEKNTENRNGARENEWFTKQGASCRENLWMDVRKACLSQNWTKERKKENNHPLPRRFSSHIMEVLMLSQVTGQDVL